ncbi:MAG: LysM peptidoglycan-binding domain-containing protein [Burkholderiales bacterium]|nr:LysM peptidoglycan-binding domain-containing protein [Burkholderiales bacterium]
MRSPFLSFVLTVALGIAVPAAALAQAQAPRLADNAPDRHVVVPGDTLWGIAAKFLKDPYRWPDVWEPNRDRIKNPHRIYPGDVIVLDRSGAMPKLKLATVKVVPRTRIEQTSAAIPSIPANIIEPFLTQPLVVEEGGLANAPKIIATQEGRVYLGRGDLAYATGNVDDKVATWSVYRPGSALVDPVTKETLGYEALFLGTARLERKTVPTTLRIIDSKQEIGTGDRLTPTPRPDVIEYAPRAPKNAVDARVLSMVGGVRETGSNRIIALSKGKRDGVEEGHVLALYSYGAEVLDRTSIYDRNAPTVRLPDERNGLVFVFRVFDRVSYGLVMSAERPVKVGDVAQKP